MSKLLLNICSKIFVSFLGLLFFGIALLAIAVIFTFPSLPSLDKITHYQPQLPLRIYTQDNVLIGIYGEQRRSFKPINEFPEKLKEAVISAEDKRFYEHSGFDTIGIARAFIQNIISASAYSGASTITQQVARNFYLTKEKKLERKFKEILLSYKIERSLTKDQILELYFNQIYLGERAYGFAAAAQAYFKKPVEKISYAEAAILASLPKFPSSGNPFVNPKRAKQRQLYVLNNMLEMKMITASEYEQAKNEKIILKKGLEQVNENALYIAEMVRDSLYKKYGDSIYTEGMTVYTTVNSKNQEAATSALRKTLLNNSRSAFKGAEHYVDISHLESIENRDDKIKEIIEQYHTVSNLVPAIVSDIKKIKNIYQTTLFIAGVDKPVILKGAELNYIHKAINNDKLKNKRVRVGSILRVVKVKKKWALTQIPELQGAIVSIDAKTGAILALVGGFDFYEKQFNRATQAFRQSGSTFKPFIYSAALEKGMTPNTVVNDTKITFGNWSPKNANGKYSGITTFQEALIYSKNVPSVRIMQAVGVDYALNYIQKFGFDRNKHPRNYTMVLGTGSTTPIEMARAYAVFANGGYLVQPYFIDKIYDSTGQLIAQTSPLIAGKNAQLVIDPRNAFTMYRIMQEVVRRGTATAANQLGRSDLAGKTGTTNDQKDAWFVGFNNDIVTSVFIGFDTPKNMGAIGYGGRVALPVWIDYMAWALKGKPVSKPVATEGIKVDATEEYLNEKHSSNPPVQINNSSDSDAAEYEIIPEGKPPSNKGEVQKNNDLDALF